MTEPRHRAASRTPPPSYPPAAPPGYPPVVPAPSYPPAVPSPAVPSAETVERDRGASLRRTLGRVVGMNASRNVREYLELQRQLTTAVAFGRRIVVLSVDPAAGSTTVSALLAIALATRRADPVLLVDAAAPGRNPLHRVFDATPARTMRDLAARPPRIAARTDFAGQLTDVGSDLWLLPGDADPMTTSGAAPDAATYARAVSPFIRYFDLSITDLGYTPGQGTAELALDRAHAVCLVTSATREGFDMVTAKLRGLRDNAGAAWAGRTLVVVDRPRGARGRPFTRRRLPARGVPVTELDFDPQVGPGFPSRLAELAPETHLAAMRLAADVLGTAVPGATEATLLEAAP